MKKLFTLGILLLLGATVLGPSQGQAFNSGTHIYIAERVFPWTFDKINLYYGSIAPDIALYVPEGAAWTLEEAFEDTHYEYIYLPYTWWKPAEKAFAKGWQTHNEEWGADYYAHGIYPSYGGYVNIQASRLVDFFAELKDSPELAHFAIEVAIDILLVRYHDPSLGLKLLWAAKYRSQKDVDLMVSTFATDEEISDALKAAENYFLQDLVIKYAMALALPDPLRMVALGKLGSQIAGSYDVVINPAEVRRILRIAMYLCQDSNYMEVIQTAIEEIR